MTSVSVRYIVSEVDAAIGFYCGLLGFDEVMHPSPTFAMLRRGELRMVLSAPGGGSGGGQAMPDGTAPTPGGRNRFQLEVADLAETVAELRASGAHFGPAHRGPGSAVRRDGVKSASTQAQPA
ncbi:MAG: VOC family protein [Pseudonocardiales bacterium]